MYESHHISAHLLALRLDFRERRYKVQRFPFYPAGAGHDGKAKYLPLPVLPLRYMMSFPLHVAHPRSRPRSLPLPKKQPGMATGVVSCVSMGVDATSGRGSIGGSALFHPIRLNQFLACKCNYFSLSYVPGSTMVPRCPHALLPAAAATAAAAAGAGAAHTATATTTTTTIHHNNNNNTSSSGSSSRSSSSSNNKQQAASRKQQAASSNTTVATMTAVTTTTTITATTLEVCLRMCS